MMFLIHPELPSFVHQTLKKKKNTHAPHVHNMKSIEEQGTWERDREIRENKDSTHKRTHELKHFVFFFCKKEQKEERIKQNKT